MSNLKFKGIVIKSIDYKERDKILTILTFEKGKITVMAKGVKKAKAKLSYATRLLYCGNFEIVESKNRKILTDASIIADYSNISSNLKKFYYAAHYIEIASMAVMEEQPDEDVVRLLLNTLYMLTKDNMDMKLLTVLYEMRIVALNGFAPNMDGCTLCGRHEANMKFSIKEGGLVCCDEGMLISDKACDVIRYISSCEDKTLFKISVTKEIIDELYFISRQYIERIFEVRFNKADILKD